MKNPENKIIAQSTKDLIDKLLLEKITLAGIAKVTEGSRERKKREINYLVL